MLKSNPEMSTAENRLFVDEVFNTFIKDFKSPSKDWFVPILLCSTLFLLFHSIPLLNGPAFPFVIMLLWMELLPIFLLFLYALAGLFNLPKLIYRFARKDLAIKKFLSLLMVVIFSFGALFLAARLGRLIRTHAFHRLAQRSSPLISAIHSYHEEKGRPPASLGQLVPEYIYKIPGTEMMAYPEFQYKEIESETKVQWEIFVSCPSGGNFDRFFYWPTKEYPDEIYGGVVQRIDDWAYVHE